MVAVLVIILVIICVINITVTVTAISTSNVGLKIKALSVFRPDETDMHKYSAILAATEPFRLQCTKQIKESINPLKYLLITISGIYSCYYLCILYI